MNLGLIADIHADFPALLHAVERLRANGVDQIVCAGDLVEKGPDGNAVVKFLRAEGIPCVRGNHDIDIIDHQRWLRENGDPDNPAVLARLLSDELLAYLQTLPDTLSLSLAGHRVLVAHGTPWNPWQYMFPTAPRAIFEQIAAESGADVVVLGHTHTPMRVRVGEVWIVNPGSVSGTHAFGSHTCAILTLPERAFQVLDITTGQFVPPDEITL